MRRTGLLFGILTLLAGAVTSVGAFGVPSANATAFSYIVICKDTPSPKLVTGSFTFSISGGGNGPTSVTVPVGQCSAPKQIPWGGGTNATITETAVGQIYVAGVSTIPSDRLLSHNPLSWTAVVSTVPSDTTVVHFSNNRVAGPR